MAAAFTMKGLHPITSNGWAMLAILAELGTIGTSLGVPSSAIVSNPANFHAGQFVIFALDIVLQIAMGFVCVAPLIAELRWSRWYSKYSYGPTCIEKIAKPANEVPRWRLASVFLICLNIGILAGFFTAMSAWTKTTIIGIGLISLLSSLVLILGFLSWRRHNSLENFQPWCSLMKAEQRIDGTAFLDRNTGQLALAYQQQMNSIGEEISGDQPRPVISLSRLSVADLADNDFEETLADLHLPRAELHPTLWFWYLVYERKTFDLVLASYFTVFPGILATHIVDAELSLTKTLIPNSTV
ncbi:hypothetical protein GQ53DRAFT_829013 [Thozetella sp. PMI_491]|nr:hypothetical protein GQ53DRAFT_829013 [Thozetella sp. PMI_491]